MAKIGKICRLMQKTGSEFDVVYWFGVNSQNLYSFNFGTIRFSKDTDKPKTYISGISVHEQFDSYFNIIVEPADYNLNDNEAYLLVIIPDAWNIKASKHRIAGRYFSEAVFILEAGDTLEASTGPVADTVHYVVEKKNHELYLTKQS